MILKLILSALALISIVSASYWVCTSGYSIALMYNKLKDGTLKGGKANFMHRLRIELECDFVAITLSAWTFIELVHKLKNESYVIGSTILNNNFARPVQWLIAIVMVSTVIGAGLCAYRTYYKMEARYSEYIERTSSSIHSECGQYRNTAQGKCANQRTA